jgi:hypothetical protein
MLKVWQCSHIGNYISLYLWLYKPCGPSPLFQFLNLHTVGRNPGMGISPSQGRYLYKEHKQNKRTQISML